MEVDAIGRAKAPCCDGKFAYKCRGDAQKECKRKKNKVELLPYRCPFCGFWHVGHKPSGNAKHVWKKNLQRIKKRKKEWKSKSF